LVDEQTLSRIEDAGLNASAPPQQRWLDGWIVRTSPGKARRARCINAVAAGRLGLDRKLELAAAVFREAGLPMVMRMTRFTLPTDLDAQVAARGWDEVDDTRVMVRCDLGGAAPPALPAGMQWVRLGAAPFAQAVGALRGSPPAQIEAHAERLALCPVPYQGYAICRQDDQAVLACGQFAREAELVGLYDVFTRGSERGQRLAGVLCERLLSLAALEGAKVAYLQTEAANHPARQVYRRMGFADAYSYRYRQPPA